MSDEIPDYYYDCDACGGKGSYPKCQEPGSCRAPYGDYDCSNTECGDKCRYCDGTGSTYPNISPLHKEAAE